jgi:uridine kinase
MDQNGSAKGESAEVDAEESDGNILPPPGSVEGLAAMLTGAGGVGSGDSAPSGAMGTKRKTKSAQSASERGEPFLIGVAGGTASGKTTVCNRIMQQLQQTQVALISQDSFYKPLGKKEQDDVANYNFDHPEAIDTESMLSALHTLKQRSRAELPVYDFTTHTRKPNETEIVYPADVIILEGILVLSIPDVRQQCHMRIFVDTDDDVRLARRIRRDTSERGRNVEGVIEQYTKFVKPMFDAYVLPSKKFADVIIPWASGENSVAINLIVEHIRTKLGQDDLRAAYSNLSVLPGNFQTRGMHTIIRDAETERHDFVFYSDRLFRLILEHALSSLPFHQRTVRTPAGECYKGFAFSRKLCGVSVIRSGEAMENALRACCKGVKIGKVLIHRHDSDTGSDVTYHKLPSDIHDRYCLLMDPILATGNSASAAIDVLLEHGVREQHIVFTTLLAAPRGVRAICSKYPSIQVVTSEVDDTCTDEGVVMPGVGEFGDRYFSCG